jgi:hypothetical protein
MRRKPKKKNNNNNNKFLLSNVNIMICENEEYPGYCENINREHFHEYDE